MGRITGLVVDCGHLESVALPVSFTAGEVQRFLSHYLQIFASRPLFPQLRTTPLAGARFTQHLRALLLMFATYLPPLASLGSTVTVPPADRATRVPREILTDELVEEIKTRCCFVSDIIPDLPGDISEATPTPDDDTSEMEVPSSDSVAPSESGFSTADSDHPTTSSQVDPSESSGAGPSSPSPSLGAAPSESHLQGIANLYEHHSRATPIRIRVTPPQHQQTGTGLGTLVIPGWIRERAAEVLFEGGDIDESSLAELILNVLLRTPRDLRKTLACSILVTGGTAMIPGFIPRLHSEILRAIQPQNPGRRSQRRPVIPGKPLPPVYGRFESLRPLVPYIAILNDPSPLPATSGRAAANAGKAPAFTPSLIGWVGGSLAGYVCTFYQLHIYSPTSRALKTGGVEVSREKWDEADPAAQNADDEDTNVALETPNRFNRGVLPDWTRTPLPAGAPSATAKPPATPLTLTPQAVRVTSRP